ncbi:unnamed protein product, partial [Gongylonema pulchrum]|uniref:PH domain-containing protein n=1 Tax=Gongylonema pulchrum TaxID=637853 RepID=A0A183EQ01_9BILA
TCSLGFSETSKTSPVRFEIWDETKSEAYVVHPVDETARIRWIQQLYRIVGARVTDRDRLNHHQQQQQQHRPARPQSWASTISNESTRSSTDTATDSSVMDGNGNNNNQIGECCSSLSSGSPTFVPVSTSEDDPDNNVNPTDPVMQTRSFSCPENLMIYYNVSAAVMVFQLWLLAVSS